MEVKRFALVLPELFKLYDLHLLAREKFEQTLELLSVKSSIDISKAARFSRRRAGDARFFFSHGIEKIQRLATFESLHVPMRKGAVDWISQKDQQFDFRIVFPNPFRRRFVIDVTWRAITCDG